MSCILMVSWFDSFRHYNMSHLYNHENCYVSRKKFQVTSSIQSWISVSSQEKCHKYFAWSNCRFLWKFVTNVTVDRYVKNKNLMEIKYPKIVLIFLNFYNFRWCFERILNKSLTYEGFKILSWSLCWKHIKFLPSTTCTSSYIWKVSWKTSCSTSGRKKASCTEPLN